MMEQKSSKKEELLNIAGDLFYRQGYGATGIKQIIEEAGIAKGTFYSHFNSKEQVGIEWLEARNLQWHKLVETAMSKAQSPQAKILASFHVLEEVLESFDFRGCAFLNSLAELPQSTGEMREQIRLHKESICSRFIELAREHYSHESDDFAEQKGRVIFLLFEGAIVESQNFRDLWPVKVAREEVKKFLES